MYWTPVQRLSNTARREVNYIFMKMQRLKKANAQKRAELLAVVSISGCIGYSNEQTAFSGCFETMGQIHPSGREYASSLE